MRRYLFQKEIDNNYNTDKGSIPLPSEVHKIRRICPDMVNGSGFISIFNEKDDECILNQFPIADDNEHINKKDIDIYATINGDNLYYVFELVSVDDPSKESELKILITYEEEKRW